MYKNDESFLAGKQFIKEGKYDEAADCYSQLLKKIGESGEDADMSPDCAPIWFAYGDALLRQEEENPTDDLLGTAASEAKKAAASLASELSGPGDGDDDDDDEDDEDENFGQQNDNSDGNGDAMNAAIEQQQPEGGDDDDGSDMQIAWECLETCRRICEAGPMSSSSDDADNGDLDYLLSETLLRLGDLLRFNGQFNDAITEYHNSLKLKIELSKDEDTDRDLSSTYFMIASAHIYNASEIAQAENEAANGGSSSSSSSSLAPAGKSAAIAEKKKALYNYQMCLKILQNILNKKPAASAVPGAEVKDKTAAAVTVSTADNMSVATSSDSIATVTSTTAMSNSSDSGSGGGSGLSGSPVTISAADKEMEDVAEMRDELVETCDALKAEIKACELEAMTGPSPGITTTIGFGQPSHAVATSSSSSSSSNSSSASAFDFSGNVAPRAPGQNTQGQGNVFSFGTTSAVSVPNAFGFGSANSGFTSSSADGSGSGSGSGGAATMMQVKKKVKLNPAN